MTTVNAQVKHKMYLLFYSIPPSPHCDRCSTIASQHFVVTLLFSFPSRGHPQQIRNHDTMIGASATVRMKATVNENLRTKKKPKIKEDGQQQVS